jgi:hypothetical protein
VIVEDDLKPRDRDALDHAKARAQEAQRLAEEEDERVIANMNATRAEQGRTLLNEQQDASVRENRRSQRALRA